MKLLAVDYDGTFKTDIKNFYLNIIEVEKFREKGNKFAIVTGRSFKSIKRELKRYDIKYDYLSCNNGLVIFDANDNLVAEFPLDKETIELVNDTKTYNYNIQSIEYYDAYSKTQNLDNVVEIGIKFNGNKSCKIYKNTLEKLMPNVSLYKDNKRVFIGDKVNKSDAVYLISQLENIYPSDIYTIGDGNNDLEMLKKYNGHRVLYSYPSLWNKKIPVTREVHTFVKKLNRK